jgi:hypothetical protein
MTILVEDGTIVTDANSYVTVEEARAYARARGTYISDATRVVEQELVQAMDYLESLRNSYKGKKTDVTQTLQWPRQSVYIDGELFASDAIPTELKAAQMRLVMEIEAGFDPMGNSDGLPFIVSERVDVLETKYSEGIATSGLPILRKVEALLAPLLTTDGLLTVVRA